MEKIMEFCHYGKVGTLHIAISVMLTLTRNLTLTVNEP